MATERFPPARPDPGTLLRYVRMAVYFLTGVLALSLLMVGTVGIIAELKGSWHWQVHLQSTVSYGGVFVTYLLALLVPLFVLLVVGRQVVDDA